MAFIDKIGEKITSGANAVTASAKQMTETARINNEISANTAEIDRKMLQIGRCVKARLMDSITDEEVLALAHDIDAFIARNEQLAEEIKTLKGIRKCEKCGENLAAGCVYCPSCGAKNEPLQQSSAKASVKAKPVAAQDFSGNPTQQTAAFVPAEPQAEQSEPVQQSAPVPPVNRAPAAIFCGQCGYKETPDAVFCSNCGSKLQK